ncbi:hypothetical protein [Streptococcus loxodontisalivarius]|uniref:DUF1433 domain-containing protein n=1 Tax=Streptococcus loxodontisalivarius TaxID=1349415 RepID=A0ABS2PRT7_9STRE|nr:hypothetical protein [Streptococcus loxodontisalivarius]MBM7642751.1 hypothetical protein [Streptococcus loxodontisalivarius]
MKLKKYFLVLIGMVCFITILEGCSTSNKSTLTKEQQNQIVQYIANNFEEIKIVEFENIDHNKLAETTFINLKVNENSYLSISVGDDIYDVDNYSPGWNPDSFKLKEKSEKRLKTDISSIEIIYLGEQNGN